MINLGNLKAMALAAQEPEDHYITRSISMKMFSNAASPGTILGLIDQIDSLRKDAERYRWLLENADEMHWENMLHEADFDGLEGINQIIDGRIACSSLTSPSPMAKPVATYAQIQTQPRRPSEAAWKPSSAVDWHP